MTNRSRERSDRSDPLAEEAFAIGDLRARLDRIGSHRLLFVLDAVALGLIAATFLQLGPPELLFHGVFVVLTIDAFVFGRKVTYQRIVASSIAMLGYVALPAVEAGVEPLDLTEWPLMFAIAILVALMADRERGAVRRYAALYRDARDRLVTAQEEERRRLSRELHDGIGQTLTALTLSLDAASDAASSGAGGDPDASIHRARTLASTALEEARSVAERVRPPRLERRGLASALHELAVRCGVPVTLEIDARAAAELPAEHVIEAYRIAQEALGNAVRHAAAQQIEVRIERDRHGVRLTIADDGVGFDVRADHRSGLGLTGMRERALLMGARLRIASRIGGGTRIDLRVPTSNSDATPVQAPFAHDRP